MTDIKKNELAQNLAPSKTELKKIALHSVPEWNTRVMTDVGLIAIVEIDTINPYDESHFPFGDSRWRKQDKVAEEHDEPKWSEKGHREGVDKLKDLIEEGYIPRPILVFNGFKREHIAIAGNLVDWKKIRYQRLDGFTRYMALKELDYKWIFVQIIGTWLGGAQVNQPWVL